MATRLRVAGLVQGVGYRATFEAQARALRLRGWVRNRSDGSVEAVVSGPPEAVQRIVEWSRRGPQAARVSQVTVSEADEPAGDGFEVRPTA